MSAIVALLICTTIVMFLLRFEHKQAPDMSRALWIPAIWMLYAMSKPLGIWFHNQGTIESGSPLDRALLMLILCFSVIVLLKRHFDWSDAARTNPWLMVLFGCMTVSLLWSSIPFISFKRWARELTVLAVAFQLLSEQYPRRAFLCLLRRTIYILVPFSLLLIKYFPEFGRHYNRWTGGVEWTGVADTKNHLAKLCILAIFILLWELRQRMRGTAVPVIKYQIFVDISLILFSLLLLGGPHRSLIYSATSTIVFLVGILVFAGLLWLKKRRISLGFTISGLVLILIIVYGTLMPFIGGLSFWDISSYVGRESTLTTRTTSIWPILIPLAMKRPVLGHGIGGFWTTTMSEQTANNAHNGYLDVLLHFGFVGLVLVVFFILSYAKNAIKAMEDDTEWGILSISLAVMFLVHNFTESSIQSFTTGLTTIILFFSISNSKYTPRKKAVPLV